MSGSINQLCSFFLVSSASPSCQTYLAAHFIFSYINLVLFVFGNSTITEERLICKETLKYMSSVLSDQQWIHLYILPKLTFKIK